MTNEQTDRITEAVSAMPYEERNLILSSLIYRLMKRRLNENEAPYCDSEKLGFMSEILYLSSQGPNILSLEAELDIEEERIAEAAK